MDLTYEKMMEISVAGAGLLAFVLAVIGYSNVARQIHPKRAAVLNLEKNLQQSKGEYEKITRELVGLKEQLGGFQQQFHRAKEEQAELREMAAVMERRLFCLSF